MDSANDEDGSYQPFRTSTDQGIVDTATDNYCGCLPEPPSFHLPSPPVPPPSMGEFGAISEGVDWLANLNSDSSFESCQKDIDRWTNSAGNDLVPKWTDDQREENSKGNGDDFFYSTPTTPRFLNLFQQPLTGIVIIAAASCVLLLSICLLALYCRRKSRRQNCCCVGLHGGKADANYERHNAYPPLTNDLLQRQGKAKLLAVMDGASPATTATTIVCPAKSRYRGKYSLTNACDSAEDTSEGETDFFLGKGANSCAAAPTEWSYNAMRPDTVNVRMPNGNRTHHRIIANNCPSITKYGAIPTSPPSYENSTRIQPMPVMVVRTENGKLLTRASPILPGGSSQADPTSSVYDSHNPIYEEISLHEKSDEIFSPVQQTQRRLSERIINYVDSGASSGNSDENLHVADEEERKRNNSGYCVVDGTTTKTTLTVEDSPCCSSGRSECEECFTQETYYGHHNKEACPFSPRSRKRSPLQDFSHNISATPSPIRNKFLTNKVNRSTQSGESCLGNDEFYANTCCECSGRESGYGTQSRCPSSAKKRIRDGARTNVGKIHATGSRDQSPLLNHQNTPFQKFYSLKKDSKFGHLNLENGRLTPNTERLVAKDVKTMDAPRRSKDTAW